jgi:hypothetical protein
MLTTIQAGGANMNALEHAQGKLTDIKVTFEFDHGAKPSATLEFKTAPNETFNGLWCNLNRSGPITVFVSKKSPFGFVVDHRSSDDVD